MIEWEGGETGPEITFAEGVTIDGEKGVSLTAVWRKLDKRLGETVAYSTTMVFDSSASVEDVIKFYAKKLNVMESPPKSNTYYPKVEPPVREIERQKEIIQELSTKAGLPLEQLIAATPSEPKPPFPESSPLE